jgi:hypothetical protein
MAQDIDGVLSHTPVGRELAAHNGDHAVNFLQHHMRARQIGRTGASIFARKSCTSG